MRLQFTAGNLKKSLGALATKLRNFKKYRDNKYPNWLKYGKEFMHFTVGFPLVTNNLVGKSLSEDCLVNDIYHTRSSFISSQQLRAKKHPGVGSTG